MINAAIPLVTCFLLAICFVADPGAAVNFRMAATGCTETAGHLMAVTFGLEMGGIVSFNYKPVCRCGRAIVEQMNAVFMVLPGTLWASSLVSLRRNILIRSPLMNVARMGKRVSGRRPCGDYRAVRPERCQPELNIPVRTRQFHRLITIMKRHPMDQ